jgi:GntR family transcriptional repressor for pyruvate dehydrogenase complex
VFQPQVVRRPRQQVESQLDTAIVTGQFKPGEKLPSEVDLASRFGVSRTTIREALRSLTSAGLVRKVPGATGGTFVMAVDHRALGGQIGDSVATILRLGSVTLPELLAVRKILEVPAADGAATHRTEEQLAIMRATVERVKGLELGDPEVADLDATFHSTIAEASGNRMLSAFVCALHQATRPARYLKFSAKDGRETVLQHIAIVKSIAASNGSGAARAMEEHLNYLEHVKKNPDFDPSSDFDPSPDRYVGHAGQ